MSKSPIFRKKGRRRFLPDGLWGEDPWPVLSSPLCDQQQRLQRLSDHRPVGSTTQKHHPLKPLDFQCPSEREFLIPSAASPASNGHGRFPPEMMQAGLGIGFPLVITSFANRRMEAGDFSRLTYDGRRENEGVKSVG